MQGTQFYIGIDEGQDNIDRGFGTASTHHYALKGYWGEFFEKGI